MNIIKIAHKLVVQLSRQAVGDIHTQHQEHIITRKKGRGKEREAPTQQIENSNFSHGSCVTIHVFRHYANLHLPVDTSAKQATPSW